MDRTIVRIIELLTADVKTPRGIKRIYNGDPLNTPNSDYPLIIVRGTSHTNEPVDTIRSADTLGIDIIVSADARSVINADIEENTPERLVRRIMEERQTGGNELRDDTVMGVIFKEFLYDTTYNIDVDLVGVQYGSGIARQFATEYPTYDAVMSLSVRTNAYTVNPKQ